jgi:hypothetical protein
MQGSLAAEQSDDRVVLRMDVRGLTITNLDEVVTESFRATEKGGVNVLIRGDRILLRELGG